MSCLSSLTILSGESTAGIERGAQLAMYHVNEALSSLTLKFLQCVTRIVLLVFDKAKLKKLKENQGSVREHLVITRYNPERAAANEMMVYR